MKVIIMTTMERLDGVDNMLRSALKGISQNPHWRGQMGLCLADIEESKAFINQLADIRERIKAQNEEPSLDVEPEGGEA